MAEPKKPSLTVLGGSMAGTRFLVPEGPASLLVGSDDACHFQLALPGVSAEHARISVGPAGFLIHEAGSPLFVNDNPVVEPTPLHNGDIVWLGTPGEPDVVMLQCILPPRPAPAAAPPPAPPPDEDFETGGVEETMAIGREEPGPAPEAASSTPEFAAVDEEYVGEERPPEPSAPRTPQPGSFEAEAVQAMFESGLQPEELPVEVPPEAPPVAAEPDLVVEAEPEPIAVTPEPEPEPTLAMSEPEEATPATMIMGEPVEEAFFIDETGGPAPPEETLVLPPPEPAPPPPEPPPPPPQPPAAPAAAPAKTPPPAPAPPPGAAAAPAVPRPARPSTSGSAAAVSPARRREAPAVSRPPARAKASSPVGLYAAIGVAALAVVGGGAYAAWRILTKPKAATGPPPITEAELAQVASTPPAVAPAPATAAPPRVEPTPPPPSAPPPVFPSAKPSAPVPATPAPPTPRPSASMAPPPKAATAAPPSQSAEALRAQQTAAQVASLTAQAESALAARQYDAAIGHFDEVLKLDPQNAKAAADKATAVSLRDAARKSFVPGRTIVKTEKAAGGLAGFEGADVQKAAVQGRIDFEISPASGIRPGDSYNLKFYLVNEGKKAIRVAGITATTVVNGTGSGGAVASRVKDVDPQQRVLLGEVSGAWKEGTTSWSAEVVVAANKGDSLKNTLTWR